ncbi:ribosome biogenesis GTPase Der [Patescibacteria group bacterium]
MGKKALPVVALVGRTNVGKSTLFNIILGKKQALVSTIAGTTRDSNQAEIAWRDVHCLLIDSGGLERKERTVIDTSVQEQVGTILSSASVICQLVDGKTGVTNEDRLIAKHLQKLGVPVMLVINKLDSPKDGGSISKDFYSLGYKEIFPLSSTTGMGVGDFLDEIVKKIKKTTLEEVEKTGSEIRLALIGKTNTGKSTFINALIGEKRLIESPLPHTTREPRDTRITHEGKTYVFIDTAGLRKERKVSDSIERAANLLSAEAIKKVHIAVVITDVTERLTMHDFHVVDLARKARRGIIIVGNKWDLVENKTPDSMKEFTKYYRYVLSMIPWAPLVFTSATKKQRVRNLLALADTIRESQLKHIPDEELKTFLIKFLGKHGPNQRQAKKKPRIFSLVQERTDPPRFRLTVNDPETIHPSFVRFMEKHLRETFGFVGTPLSITLTTRLR